MPAPSSLSVRLLGAVPVDHVHDHFQVLWALDGHLELEVERRGQTLQAGQGLLIRPGEQHEYESRHGSRCLVLDTGDGAWRSRAVQPANAAALHHLACYLASGLEAGLDVAAELGPRLLARSWGGVPAAPRRPRRDVDWAGLRRWIAARLDHPLDAAALAERACLGESQFRERCLDALGCSPMQWVRTLRLEQARALREAGASVAEAARRCGYDSPSALTAALRRDAAAVRTGVPRRQAGA